MIEIVKQTIDFYTKYLKEPTAENIQAVDPTVFSKKGSCFVTLYKNGEIRGSAGNIKEIESSLWIELIKNTVAAISKDKRFTPLTLGEIKDIRIRVDIIEWRNILEEGKIFTLDPLSSWVIAIKKDYSKLAVVLPNISPKLMTGKDIVDMLEVKLDEKLVEADYILYDIKTKIDRNY